MLCVQHLRVILSGTSEVLGFHKVFIDRLVPPSAMETYEDSEIPTRLVKFQMCLILSGVMFGTFVLVIFSVHHPIFGIPINWIPLPLEWVSTLGKDEALTMSTHFLCATPFCFSKTYLDPSQRDSMGS